MTINMATSSTGTSYNTNSASSLSSSSSAVSTSTSELTEEESQYDVNNDGELSATEKAAMQEAQSNKKALEAVKTDSSSESGSVSVNISQEALKMQEHMQDPSKSPQDVNGMPKKREEMEPQNNQQRLMNEAISEYKKYSAANYLSTAV